MKLNICNWNSYNARKELKSRTWFRIDSGHLTGSQTFGLTAEQKLLWLVILSVSCQENTSSIVTDIDYLHHLTGINTSKILKHLDKIQEKQLLTIGEHEQNTNVHEQTQSSAIEESREEKSRVEKSSSKSMKIDIVEVANLWNKMAEVVGLPKIKQNMMSVKRTKRFYVACKQVTTIDDWKKVLKQVPQNPFNRGENSRSWMANWDWLFKNENYIKLLEEFENENREIK